MCGFILTAFFFLVNSNVLFTFGYKFESNGTMITQCFATIPSTQWMSIWNNVIFIFFILIFFYLFINYNKGSFIFIFIYSIYFIGNNQYISNN